MTGSGYPENDPRHHATQVRERFHELVEHLRSDVTKVTDPRAEALFETSAEVLAGLEKAFADYEQHNEPAWQS
jgi:hypothetical protein